MTTSRKKGGIGSIILVILLALITFFYKSCRNPSHETANRTNTTVKGDWRHHKLVYTKHARCRMECRDITTEEVAYILANGTINEAKSKEENDEADGHCPTYALEGNTLDGQHVRMVFGTCDKITKVITVIDLGADHTCNCN